MNPPALKAHAVRVVEGCINGELVPPDPNHSLVERKVAIDSRIAALTHLLFRDIEQTGVVAALGDSIQADVSADTSHLEAYKNLSGGYFRVIAFNELKNLRDDPAGQHFAQNIEQHREAYRAVRPKSSNTMEQSYESLETLIGSGVDTASQHIAYMLCALEVAAIGSSIPLEDRPVLARRSSHLIHSLAKLTLADLERYVTMLNDHDEALFAIVKIHKTEANTAAHIHPRIFQLIRSLAPDPKPHYDYRPHLGCPASVSISLGNSAIQRLWDVSVASLDAAGMWSDYRSEPEVLSSFVASPNTKEGADCAQ